MRTPNALIIGSGIRSRSPPMSKFCSDLCVCAPHNLKQIEEAHCKQLLKQKQEPNSAAQNVNGDTDLSLGTRIGPKVCRSSLKALDMVWSVAKRSITLAKAGDAPDRPPSRRPTVTIIAISDVDLSTLQYFASARRKWYLRVDAAKVKSSTKEEKTIGCCYSRYSYLRS